LLSLAVQSPFHISSTKATCQKSKAAVIMKQRIEEFGLLLAAIILCSRSLASG
jgi:hypothetical protein